MAHLARAINNAFKRGGLTLQGDAFSALKGFLNDKADVKEELAEALNQVIEQIKAQELSTMLVSVEMINIAISRIQHLQSVENPSRIDFIQVIDAFDTPKYFYNNTRKTFNIVPHQIARHGEAQDKAAIFRDRWNLLYQRLLRNDLFAPPPITKGAAARQSYYQITHIESLIGSPGTKCIFGFLCQVEEGKWYIEDHNSRVRVNISDAKITAGLFTENSIVLAEGSLQDSIFVVVHMGFPPPERRVDTLTAFPLFAPADSTGQRRSQVCLYVVKSVFILFLPYVDRKPSCESVKMT
jgi:DNA polymerase epsilon subunit 2